MARLRKPSRPADEELRSPAEIIAEIRKLETEASQILGELEDMLSECLSPVDPVSEELEAMGLTLEG